MSTASDALSADGLGRYQQQVEGALDAAGLHWSDQDDLKAHLSRTRTAIAELKASEQQAKAVLEDQRYSHQHRIEQADKLRTEAEGKAKAALAYLQQSAEAVQTKLRDTWKPKPPKQADSSLLLARKLDYERLLDAVAGADGNWAHVTQRAAELFAEAVKRGDQLGAYVLGGEGPGTLDLFYQAKGVKPEVHALTFAKAAGALRPEVAAITADDGALAAFVQSARNQATRTVAAMKQAADTLELERLGTARAAQTFGWKGGQGG